MAELASADEIESLRFDLEEVGRSIRRSSFRHHSSRGSSMRKNDEDDEIDLQWAAIERLPTWDRLRSSLFDEQGQDKKVVVDVRKIGAIQRRLLIDKLIQHIETDNRRLLGKLRERIDRVGVKLPTVEVRYKNLCVEAECQVVGGKPLPTLWNTAKSIFSGFARLSSSKSQQAKISIVKDVSGIIKPSRMTLLLGPPGCGKTTLLLALAGKLNQPLKLSGEISYNGYRLNEFVPQKTSAYISQNDLHIPEMTVRETLDFSARCQGVGSRYEIMMEVSRREKEVGIVPESDIDTYMKATSIEGLKRSLQTDYMLKILGLDICADTMVGDAMRRGISGGQKKRLTTGEMIVGPTKALFMDEISTGLDSSTTFQIVSCLQHLVHITDTTALISLLQPAPETYNLFDDIILMAEGKIIYHGPCDDVLKFFKDCGKDQEQYWYHTDKPYSYVSVDHFSKKFKACLIGQKLDEELSSPYDKSQSHKNALSFNIYSLHKWELFRACMTREWLLMKRNSFVYIFKATQLLIVALITMTVFLRTRLRIDVVHANYYMGSLFYSILILLVDGYPELSMTVSRLPVFYKQRDLYFYPAWAYCISASILKVPISLIQALVWTVLTYYVIGYSPEPGRFFSQLLLFFVVHQLATSMFRFVASFCRTVVASTACGSFVLFINFILGGFILPRYSMPGWLRWGFWIVPFTYAEIGVSGNEFLAPRWQKISSMNTTVGRQTLINRGLSFSSYFYWISIGALFGFILLFNIGFTLFLTFLDPPEMARAIISRDKLSKIQGREEESSDAHMEKKPTFDSSEEPPSAELKRSGRMVLPFEPLTMTFLDVQYFIDTPLEMIEHGFTERKLQLLCDITGAFRPGVLTALMGVSGAGKTTLMDVLSGRKTGGTIKGDIRIGGYPKVQETFARISGYCEQSDIHSPQITIEESVTYSAWLRLPCEIDKKTKYEFVDEVLQTIELDGIKDALVGIPGVSGLSTEQRKRLTVAVELVSNPSIIFMDEPTSGLDARSAAVVMRAVKNVTDTGRTVVCTIHQPSIDIFETFSELILMKRGGQIIYSGPLGLHSSIVIEYFEGITGVPKIQDNYNPATWMLEVTSDSVERQLGLDFANIYKESSLYKDMRELVKQSSTPSPESEDLHFPTQYPQNGWGQFKACLWKQHLAYWRSPGYNLVRLVFVVVASVVFGAFFWKHGKKINNQQDLFTILGTMFSAVIFLGISNCSSVLPFIATERTVLCREKFAGMYSSWAYSFAQVAIEIPYIFAQTAIFVIITYPSIGYYWSAYKIFWYLYAMFCTLLYFNYLGMLVMSLSPNVQVASIMASSCYVLLNLFSGFIVPGQYIPMWWRWFYYICPSSWTLNALFTSQYGDIEKEIVVFGETKSVASFLKDYFGFHHDRLGLVAVLLIAYPLLFAALFAHCIGKLNFQKR
ncbi:pleiotropic drug resistance protein 3-like protein isoform X1 [Cinnamomum micranthum f. kanehirae]|uniref:Pleiotropic drug resistance protein 3-like protein isoform X1 n=1 Tax=Cinnamomum micranthum f. kanehirae TaxID=337451 RepID=A0A443PWR1_9MAGN|nr:pleiotropic drug resistance protein 3-like protein isoform X1 [Cinnamomum micranthum f. kanehirae]